MRRLGFEQLEQRKLLAATVIIGGTIWVANVDGLSGNVPVRGIQVHAWIGDNQNYSPDPTGDPAAGLNGPPGGAFFPMHIPRTLASTSSCC